MGISDGQGSAPAGWFEDPDGRHQYRFWNGTAWTDHVADDGQQSLAPLAAQPASVADDDAAREHAVEELARIGDPSVIPALRKALGDSSYGVRMAAIKALGEMGPAAVEPLLHALQFAEDVKVRQKAANALGRIGDPRAVDALIEARRGSFESAKGYRMQSPEVAQDAVWALGQIGDPRAVGPLADVARSGQDSILGWSVGQAVDGIRRILVSRLSEVSEDALRDVAALDDVFKQPLQYAGYGGREMVEFRNYVDCSDIQEIARQELAEPRAVTRSCSSPADDEDRHGGTHRRRTGRRPTPGHRDAGRWFHRALVGRGTVCLTSLHQLNGEVAPVGAMCERPLCRSVVLGHHDSVSISAVHADAFYDEAVCHGEVWGIRDADGFPAPESDGRRAMPFWSTQSRAQRVIDNVEAYQGFEVIAFSLDQWRSRWLPGLHKDGIWVGLNWSGRRATGYDVSSEDVARNISSRVAH